MSLAICLDMCPGMWLDMCAEMRLVRGTDRWQALAEAQKRLPARPHTCTAHAVGDADIDTHLLRAPMRSEDT